MRQTIKASLKLLLCLFCLLTAYSAQASATALNQQQADHLKSIFSEIINKHKSNATPSATHMLFDGEVTSEISQTHYAITLPHTTIQYADGSQIKIGFISINAKPANIEGGWSMAIALPSPLELINKQGQSTGTISIGEQTTKGIWMEDAQQFLKLDAAYKNIELKDADDLIAFEIPESSLKINFEIDENALWSGPIQFKIKNLKTHLIGAVGTFSAGEIANYTKLEKFNPLAMRNNTEIWDALDSLRQEKGAVIRTPAQLTALYNLIFDGLRNSVDTAQTGFKIKDIKVEPINTIFAATKTAHYKIDQAHISMGLSNLMEKAASLRARWGFEGVETNNKKGHMEFFPSDMLADITIENIPASELISAIQSTMNTAARTPQIAGLSTISLLVRLPEILSNAGTKLQIEQNYITGKDYNIDLSANLMADITAKNTATGSLSAEMIGLDTLIDKVQNKAEQSEDKAVKAELEQLLKTLQNLHGYSIKSETENKRNTKLLVQKNGQILLNGEELNMLGLMAGQNKLIQNMIMP